MDLSTEFPTTQNLNVQKISLQFGNHRFNNWNEDMLSESTFRINNVLWPIVSKTTES